MYAQKAYDICVQFNYSISKEGPIESLIVIKLARGDTLNAIKLLEETIGGFKGKQSYRFAKTIYEYLGEIYTAKNNTVKAKQYLDSATVNNTKWNEPIENIHIQSAWTRYYLKSQQTAKAIKMAKIVLEDVEKRRLARCYAPTLELLAKTYAQNRQYDLAFQSLENARRITDSLDILARADVMLAMETRFDVKEKEETIKELSHETHEQEKQIKSSKQLQWVLIMGLAIASILLGVIFYLYRGKRQQAAELAQQNALIKKAYSEKDLLLREIHHRVKNNLQVVSSLLRLQSRHIKDVQAQEALQEGRNRVHSMALIHQYLYRDEDVTRISAEEYIQKLATTLYKSYQVSDKRIQFKTEIEPIKLDVDTAIPIGLILNELITNVLKHAFRPEQEGNLEVKLLRGGNESINLWVSDNGIGFKNQTMTANKDSFGWSLIEMFTEKLHGQLNISNGIGTTVHLQFKE
jgi:two-component system, sensor histidine kinase PdtaS